MTPRVSVVMPVRDAQRYVAEAVKSILGQTLPELELLVLDDGSSDGSGDIVRELAAADDRVRVHAVAGGGLVAALNHGCAIATAPLLARMDADDLAEPMRLARQVQAMDTEPELLLLGSAVTQIDEQGEAFATVSYPAAPGRELLKRNCFAHPTVIFRREAFERAGGYRDLFPHAEDYDLWLRLAELGRVANLPDPLLRYRIHAGQVTRKQIEEQAVGTLAAQAMARARRATGVEPPPSELDIEPDLLRRRVFEGHLEIAASRLNAGPIEEAATVLRDARTLLPGIGAGRRFRFLVQAARLALRRHKVLRAPFRHR